MFILENRYTRLEIDAAGELCSLVNRRNHREIAGRHGLARFILETPECLEFEVFPDGAPQITQTGNRIVLRFDSVKNGNGKRFSIALQAEIALKGDQILWKLSLDNRTRNAIVKEVYYPIIALAHPEPPAALLNGNHVSTKIFDIPSYLNTQCITDYMAPDQKYLRGSCVYPGRSCSVNFFLVDWGEDGFYYGCHDKEFSLTFHSVEKEQRNGSINIFMGRLPFLKPGRTRTDDTVVTSPYLGQWTAGAAKYRTWADSWFAAPEIPKHIRHMQGWQRIILHHQYGEYFYKYNELEKLYDDGLKAGLDTLLLFGWTAEGMDSGYPVYSPDETQGGFEALRENIGKVRNRGGHVILYYNGQLIDAAGKYYVSGAGRRVSIKRADGTEHREFYNFSDTGNFLREFGNKTFVVACPSCREWLDVLKKHVDFAVAVGADSIFFDQIGLASYPCCDPAHGHEVPFIGLMNEKRRMLKELYEYAKSRNPNMGLGIECTNDVMASYTDFYHICGNVAQVWNSDWKDRGTAPQFLSDAYLNRAAFPETIISTRNLRDDNDVELHVNRMILLGSRSDVEIYRCRSSIAATPKYQHYLGLANTLREKYKDVLFDGKFSGIQFHSVDHPQIQSNAFVLDDKLAVILAQNTKETLTAKLNVPGYKFLEFSSARSDVRFNGRHTTMPPDSLAVILYRKK
ncbi:MAG: hypothetical protein BWY31_02782 [Lentisphaerae bacterium ADurb.Bin242]|nr:MAG: hypothetical protein BWY31_02782 [Lentisphaerae bacterium ADurb.Bin242]